MRRILFLSLMLCLGAAIAPAQQVVPENRAEITLSFAPVVRRAAPAVVNIYATRVVEERVSPFAGDPFFSQFFGRLERRMPRLENSLGSGVIVTEDGYVVSNYHVVGEARDIRLVLADRREFAGQIVLADKEADLAVIRVTTDTPLPTLPLGDSEAIEVGDLVLAIGNPFGVGQTVSSGIVSALARPMAGGRGHFIQTDAPINPGNSGGALVDMQGRLIGINTSILTRSGGSNGIGFAIPSRLVAQYVAQARAGRRSLLEPWSGADAQPVDATLAEALGLELPTGVLISELHAQSPFAAAGLEVGDIITGIDGEPVNSVSELDYRLMIAGPDAVVVAAYVNNGEARQVKVDLSPAPEEPPVTPQRLVGPTPLQGLVVGTINPRMIAEFGLPLDARGVVVLRVEGPGLRSGLRAGDRITSINGQSMEDSGAAVAATERPAATWEIGFVRDGRSFTLRLAG